MVGPNSDPALGNVLIVGGTGFLGRHLVKELLALKRDGCGMEISVLDINIDRNREEFVTYYQGDITSKADVQSIFSKVKPQVVFHTASAYAFDVNHENFRRVNIEGTRNVVECAQEIGTVKALVYTSSSSVVLDNKTPIPNATEELPVLHYPAQPEMYSHTKAVGEDIVLAANRTGTSGTMLTVSIRPASLYGEGDELMTGNLVRSVQAGRAHMQIGPGGNLMDNTYVLNCVDAEILAAQALLKASRGPPLPATARVEGEAFFITNGDPYVFWDFGRKGVAASSIRILPLPLMMVVVWLSEWVYWIFSLGRKQPTLTRRVLHYLTTERTFSIEKARTRLGYRPRFSTAEGLRRAVEWFLEQQAMVDWDAKAGKVE